MGLCHCEAVRSGEGSVEGPDGAARQRRAILVGLLRPD